VKVTSAPFVPHVPASNGDLIDKQLTLYLVEMGTFGNPGEYTRLGYRDPQFLKVLASTRLGHSLSRKKKHEESE
jgi:hypothetical protein